MTGQKKKARKSVGPSSSSATAHQRWSFSTAAGLRPSQPQPQGVAPQPPVYQFPWPKLSKERIPSERVWKKDVNREFTKGDYINRPFSPDWDDYDTIFYNAWMSVEILPNRFADFGLMQRLQIEKSFLGLLDDIGNATLRKELLSSSFASQVFQQYVVDSFKSV
ncbi:hypothetical protein AXX17_ATUG00870 [Arabidopsis thaliana]|uniref:Uncharacterized protein n=1 Tax=Arabidopsis thaliana TaxID=3702 RepID=A0A178U9T5_ARATH|nr:hypothetical protein AXX17_ATUG00870 [Arabidopsis thaliana]